VSINQHEIKRMPLSKLKPAAYNPRQISDGAMSGLKASLKRFGLVQPLVLNKRTGNLVGGHQRYKALVDQGVKEADVVVVDLPETEEKALNMTLNNPEIQGEFTAGALDILASIEMDAPDLADDTLLSTLKKTLGAEDFETDGAEEGDDKPVEGEKTIPEMELKPFEHFDYILVVANNVQDWNYLCERLGIAKVDATVAGLAKKVRKIGLGRAIYASKLVELLEGKPK